MKSKLTKKQTIEKVASWTEDGNGYKMVTKIRHDDCCGNGHNSFAITCDITENGGEYMSGCCHDQIAEKMPELKPFLKWHGCSTDGPLHYIANTTYHARDTDHDGLKKGEYSGYVYKLYGKVHSNDDDTVIYTSDTMYTNKQNNPNLKKSNDKQQIKLDQFINDLDIPYQIKKENCEWSISEGKEIDIEAARNSAIWPDATLEQLQDKEALKARLPQLMEDFKRDVESLGLIY